MTSRGQPFSSQVHTTVEKKVEGNFKKDGRKSRKSQVEGCYARA
jgi:hypothetical protein